MEPAIAITYDTLTLAWKLSDQLQFEDGSIAIEMAIEDFVRCSGDEEKLFDVSRLTKVREKMKTLNGSGEDDVPGIMFGIYMVILSGISDTAI